MGEQSLTKTPSLLATGRHLPQSQDRMMEVFHMSRTSATAMKIARPKDVLGAEPMIRQLKTWVHIFSAH